MAANRIENFVVTCHQQQDLSGSDELKVSIITPRAELQICTIPIKTGESRSMDEFIYKEDSRRLISNGDYIQVKEKDMLDADDIILRYQVRDAGSEYVAAKNNDAGNTFSYSFQIEISAGPD